MDIQNIILDDPESVYVDFKATAYKSATFPEFIKDMMAMAKAHYDGDKYLIVGVKHQVNNERKILGLELEDLVDDATYHQVIHDNVEPEIPFLLLSTFSTSQKRPLHTLALDTV